MSAIILHPIFIFLNKPYGIISAQATPIATKTLSALPQTFFARPAVVVAPELPAGETPTHWGVAAGRGGGNGGVFPGGARLPRVSPPHPQQRAPVW